MKNLKIAVLSLLIVGTVFAGETLPPPASLAEADRARCADEAGLIQIVDTYFDAFRAEAKASSVGVGALSADENYFHQSCGALIVGFRTEQDMSYGKKKIGESFKGFLVKFQVEGIVRAGAAVALPSLPIVQYPGDGE
jgi:hypothetical protein